MIDLLFLLCSTEHTGQSTFVGHLPGNLKEKGLVDVSGWIHSHCDLAFFLKRERKMGGVIYWRRGE